MVGNGSQLIAMVGITLGKTQSLSLVGVLTDLTHSFRPLGFLVTF